jgi:2-keto-4-pentenoate hydratase/2-oxohepta-3-ene-1,7-dioic acid hydratase in catechol pathway
MKVSTFFIPAENRVTWGWLKEDVLVEKPDNLPATLSAALANWEAIKTDFQMLQGADLAEYPILEVEMLAPLPFPRSFRDFYAFEEHVKTARANRGLGMLPEWYKQPVFYFSNPNSFIGPHHELHYPTGTKKLDYELELGIIIGKQGHNIEVPEAPAHIAGYTILNDWSARDWQRDEMTVGLGPAKGKDFATSMGPFLVTPDELPGEIKNGTPALKMTAAVNGRLYSKGNSADMHFSFAEIIARASANTTLYPGEVIGSGTVGSGCILELTPEKTGGWLKAGDVVTLAIEGLGELTNTISEER